MAVLTTAGRHSMCLAALGMLCNAGIASGTAHITSMAGNLPSALHAATSSHRVRNRTGGQHHPVQSCSTIPAPVQHPGPTWWGRSH